MNLKLFSGRSNEPLAQEIATSLGTKLGDIFIHNFPSGESYCQIKENIRGDDIFFVQGITKPANENLMDLLIMADAARRASAGRITAVIPYFGYARQDRKDKSRVPISAKLVMDLLEAAGINRVLTMDLHTPQIAGFTNLPVDHLYFEPVLVNYLKEFNKEEGINNIVVVAPDVGAVKRAERYASLLNCDFAFISKKRISDDKVEISNFIGDVKDKVAIIIDDMTESCGTLVQAAETCKKQGAKRVICAVTHLCLNDTGCKRLAQAISGSCIQNFTITDFIHSNTIVDGTWPCYKPALCMKSLSVASLFSKAILSINENRSVSELFV